MLYTVYGLHEAGKPDDIQYVGMTEYTAKERLTGHKSSSRKSRYPVHRWIAKVITERKQIECRVFMQTEHADIALQMEEYLIRYFAGLDGPLHNVESNPRPLEKALADTAEALAAVQAKIADGSLNLQSYFPIP